jgi:hypothetical protein
MYNRTYERNIGFKSNACCLIHARPRGNVLDVERWLRHLWLFESMLVQSEFQEWIEKKLL